MSVICSHASQLVDALELAIRRGASGIISFGVAGGLAPDLTAGAWVVGSGIRTGQRFFSTDPGWTRKLCDALPGSVQADIVGVDAPLADPIEKRRLHAETGAAVVDMESHVAAGVAAAHRLPFAAFRVVIDAANRRLPPAAIVGLRRDGTADVGAVLQSVVQQPSQLPALIRTATDAFIAQTALRRGRELLGERLGFPYPATVRPATLVAA